MLGPTGTEPALSRPHPTLSASSGLNFWAFGARHLNFLRFMAVLHFMGSVHIASNETPDISTISK
eukprot:3579848-Karenia_brevis.AAC.1